MNIFEIKHLNSTTQLDCLRKRISDLKEIALFTDLSIFATGSYARGEASVHSDIDLFFINRRPINTIKDHNINSLKLFAKIINIAEEMGFPKFSNDGAYLKVISGSEILEHLGNANDDYSNHFTARLLLILESQPIYGLDTYDAIMKDVLGRYFEDYPDHPEDFHPTFLVNDIIRFWKTLCLNYENKRNQPAKNDDVRIAQKVKNLKLKFSRMLTCFGSICYIAAQKGPIGIEQLLPMVKLSPLDRLRSAASSFDTDEAMRAVETEYAWFLELTNISEVDLMNSFHSRSHREDAFQRAEVFGNAIFEITKTISAKTGYLRYLIV